MKENWAYKRFDDIMTPAKVVRCGQRNDLPVLSITMHGGIVKQSERFGKTIASTDKSNYKIVKDGQLVIAFPIDEGLLYTQDVASEGIMSPAYNIWDVDYTLIDKGFLVRYFHSSSAFAYYRSKLRGSTQRRRSMDKSDLLSMPIPLPPLSEQREIVAELKLIEDIIEKQESQVSCIENLSESIFFEMFGNPITNEQGWPKKRIKEISKVITGNTPSRNNLEYYNDTYIEWIKTDNISKNSINPSIAKEYLSEKGMNHGKVARAGTILMACIAGSYHSLGKCCILNRTVAFNQQINAIIPSDHIESSYLYSLFNVMGDYIKEHATNGMKHIITKSVLEQIEIPIPPKSLQLQFSEKMKSITAIKENILRSMNETKDLYNNRMNFYFC